MLMLPGQCPSVPEPENGRVSLSGVSVGDRATFSCNIGHQLGGWETVTCLSNGTWDSSPPLCRDSTTGKNTTTVKELQHLVCERDAQGIRDCK